VNGPILVKGENETSVKPLVCPGKCTYKLDTQTYSEECQCGMNNGTRYCSPGRGDLALEDYINYVKSYLANESATTACHITPGVLCVNGTKDQMSDDYYKAYVVYNNMTRWVSFADNEPCVQKTINADYWNAYNKVYGQDDDKFGLYLFLGIAIGAVVVIGVLLLIIYLKRGSDEEEGETTSPN
jgi:hypothetical protein